jgi:hypothetical protein
MGFGFGGQQPPISMPISRARIQQPGGFPTRGGVGVGTMDPGREPNMRGFKKGGKIKGKKGKAVKIKAHAGERVLTAKQNKKYEQMTRKRKKSDSNAFVAGRRA